MKGETSSLYLLEYSTSANRSQRLEALSDPFDSNSGSFTAKMRCGLEAMVRWWRRARAGSRAQVVSRVVEKEAEDTAPNFEGGKKSLGCLLVPVPGFEARL